jgi:chromosomal replication initiation ATPase DnaA
MKELLDTISACERDGYLVEASEAHNKLIKLAQQAPGNAYTYWDASAIPPAISAMLANLNYKVTQLDTQQKQMAQQMSSPPPQKAQQPNQQQQQQDPNSKYGAQQFQKTNQNPVTPNTVNYIQTPGSNPAPIELNDGQLNV